MPREIIGRPRAELRFSSDYLILSEYGYFNGSSDDTTALQDALSDGAAKKKAVYAGSNIVNISGAVTQPSGCPGLVFDLASYGAPGDPGIVVNGSGYIALTCAGFVNQFRVNMYGTGNAANGIHFDNVNFSQIQKVRVFNLNGFGMKVDKLWDSVLIDVSVEKCGNTTDYAFSLNPAGDTSNMSHICRLQVEQATAKAIWIDPTCLSCVIDNIHSESATAVAGVQTWLLGGTRGTYSGVRLTATNPATSTAEFIGENVTYDGVVVEGAGNVVSLCGISKSTIVLNAPNFHDSVVSLDTGNHSGPVVINGGQIGTLATNAEAGSEPTLLCRGTHILTCTVGDVGNPADPNILVFRDCKIDSLGSSSSNSAATFDNCPINGGGLLAGLTVFSGRTNATITTLTVPATGAAIFRDAIINGAVVITSGGTLLLRNTGIFGNLTHGGSVSSLADASSYVTGTVTGWGVPAAGPNVRALIGSNWVRGQYQHNLTPSAGGTPAWSCTTGGAPGTWKAQANVAV